MTKDADELGRELLSSGRRATGERNAEEYVFEPLAIGLTAIEIIKACNYYLYQRSRKPAIVKKLIDEMIGHLHGWGDAPWGWDQDDVAARSERPVPGSDLPAPPPPVLTEVAERLVALGWERPSIHTTVSPEIGVAIGSPLRGADEFHGTVNVSYQGAGHVSMASCQVTVAINADVAERAFTWAVSAVAGNYSRTEVRRVDNLVLRTGYGPPEHADPEASRALDQLGEPEQMWLSDEPPIFSGPAETVATHTAMKRYGGPGMAATKVELEALLETLDDTDLVERLRGVDLKTHWVLRIPGLEVDAARVDVVRGAATAHVYPRPVHLIEELVLIHKPIEESPTVLGSVVLIPRLPSPSIPVEDVVRRRA